MRALLTSLLLAGAAPFALVQETKTRHALIIDGGGVALYRDQFRASQKLPDSPTGSLVDLFFAQGYQVSWLEGKALSRAETLRHLYQVASEIPENDTVVVYCGGFIVRHPLRQGGVYWMQDGGSLAELETNGVRIGEIAEVFQKVRAREKLLLLDFLFLGDAAYTSDVDVKMQMQRQMRLYPEVSLQPGQLPLMELAALSDRESSSHIAVALSPDAASRIGTRGPLAAALRGAIAGESDRNADGLLGSVEVAEHVRDALGRRAFESGLTSSDFQMSTRIDLDWALAAAGSSDARARRERYLATLREWRARNWISVATELAARSVLDEWVRSREERTSIDPKTQELWDILQKHLEGSANDVDRARSLEAHIRKRY